MKKKITIEEEVEVCDYCEEELADNNDWCGICDKVICENHKSEFDSEDGCICTECVKKGFEMGFNNDGDFDANKIFFNKKEYKGETFF